MTAENRSALTISMNMKPTNIKSFRASSEGIAFKTAMKNQLHIQHSHRQPFIGPRPLIKDKHIYLFTAVMIAAPAVCWLVAWLCFELKNLN